MTTIRPYSPPDAEALAAVYRDSVKSIGPAAYSPEQVAVWALFPEDMGEFRERLARGLTLVAEEDGEIVAFGQLEPDGRVGLLYCRGSHARRGIGTQILGSLESGARTRKLVQLRTEASRISRPFFAKHGYQVAATEHVVRHGVEFERFRMVKDLVPPGAPPHGAAR